MSSELRIKKLRGSGGYVMAQVSDQQQVKGNLGGPDLFLAPMGRLDPEKISKHFCNTCEKEFEGSPKIDYESPNEEVAENLILAERGQYACNSCNSTIAEYREFTKSDEAKDVGMARPLQEPSAAQEAPPTKAEQQPAGDEPSAQQQPASETAATATMADATEGPAPSPVRAIRQIEGMRVFDRNAREMGTVKQVGVDSSQTVVVVISRDGDTDATVPWSEIKTIGEVVLLGDPAEAQQPQPAVQPGICPACGFSNKEGAKFCEECGSKLVA